MKKDDLEKFVDEINENLKEISTTISNLDNHQTFLREEERFQESMNKQNEFNTKMINQQDHFNRHNLTEQKKLIKAQYKLIKEQKCLNYWTMVLAIATIALVLITIILN